MTSGDGVRTLLMVIPYGIGWKAILNEKAVNYLTSRNIRLVMVAESQDIGITHPMVSNERLVPYNRSKFEIALGLLRNYVFADTSRKHSETLQLKMKVYERQTRPLVKYYSARPTFRSIDGNQAPDAVTAAIDSAIVEVVAAGGGRL